MKLSKYIVWTDGGPERWLPQMADTWERAIEIWRDELRNSTNVIVTETCTIEVKVNPYARGDGAILQAPEKDEA